MSSLSRQSRPQRLDSRQQLVDRQVSVATTALLVICQLPVNCCFITSVHSQRASNSYVVLEHGTYVFEYATHQNTGLLQSDPDSYVVTVKLQRIIIIDVAKTTYKVLEAFTLPVTCHKLYRGRPCGK